MGGEREKNKGQRIELRQFKTKAFYIQIRETYSHLDILHNSKTIREVANGHSCDHPHYRSLHNYKNMPDGIYATAYGFI